MVQCSWCLFFRFMSVLEEILCSDNTSFAFLCWWQYSSITFVMNSSEYCFFNHPIVNVELQSWQRYLCVWDVDQYFMMWFQLHLLQFMCLISDKYLIFVVLHLLFYICWLWFQVIFSVVFYLWITNLYYNKFYFFYCF